MMFLEVPKTQYAMLMRLLAEKWLRRRTDIACSVLKILKIDQLSPPSVGEKGFAVDLVGDESKFSLRTLHHKLFASLILKISKTLAHIHALYSTKSSVNPHKHCASDFKFRKTAFAFPCQGFRRA
jgi:hypothetical protein